MSEDNELVATTTTPEVYNSPENDNFESVQLERDLAELYKKIDDSDVSEQSAEDNKQKSAEEIQLDDMITQALPHQERREEELLPVTVAPQKKTGRSLNPIQLFDHSLKLFT